MLYFLDTNTVIDVLRPRHGVARRLAAVSPGDVRVSAMTVAELAYGALNSIDPAANQAQVDTLLSQIAVVSFGRRAAAEHARIRLALRAARIGEGDMIIAATALAHRGTVVTSNVTEFGRVPGLAVENWRA